jgi:hypothetical protein
MITIKTTFITLVALIAMLPTAVATAAQTQSAPVNSDASAIADFTKRVKQYHDLRDKLDEGAARQTQTAEPEKLVAEKQALAARVQAARAGSKAGDVFTPAVQPVFKRLLKATLKGTDGSENKKMIKEDSPPAMPLKVNAPYPEKQPLSAVPPDVLKQLPPLPKELEYRFVQKHLFLFDARSNLVVDVLPNAIP